MAKVTTVSLKVNTVSGVLIKIRVEWKIIYCMKTGQELKEFESIDSSVQCMCTTASGG